MAQTHPVRSRLASLIKELGGETYNSLSEKIETETRETVSPQAIARLAKNNFDRIDCSNAAALCLYGGWNLEDIFYLDWNDSGDPGVLLHRQVKREKFILNRIFARAKEKMPGKSEEIEQACQVLLSHLDDLL